MASEFYRKTKDLLEEFQNRELHYLNTERIINIHSQFTNGSSMPIQEYLQKLNVREKETEETYRGLMSKMEDLDRRTERISENLEKLNSLRAAMISKPSSWSSANYSVFDKPVLSSLYSFSSNSVPPINDVKNTLSNPSQNHVFETNDLKNTSTQTDYIFCEKCHSPFALSQVTSNLSISIVEPSTFSTLQNLNSCGNELQVITELPIQTEFIPEKTEVFPTNKDYERTHFPSVTVNIPTADRKRDPQTDVSMKVDTSVSYPNHEENINENAVQQKKSSTADVEEADLVTAKQHLADDNTSVSDNLEKTVSKSDDESLNHEFGFLESDKRGKAAKAHPEFPIEKHQRSEVIDSESNVHTSKDIINEHISVDRSNLEIATDTKSNFETIIRTENDDNKSESSVSVRGARSPSLSDKVSAVSDSDSFYEKEEPHLKNSAAYQTLLGNISAVRNVQKSSPYSESESEDEVERAVANVTRKSSHIPAPTAVTDENVGDSKKTVQETKPKSEPRKSISGNKPQQLSKNTRKVLGLDTSSASETEVQVKATTIKETEDSDEFDFYG